MVLEFNYCDYVCKYRDGEEYIKDICFSEIGHNRIGSSYFITYYISKVQEELNYIFITKQQMIDYLKEITKLLSCNICFIKDTKDYYRVQIEIPGNNKRYLIYVSTIVRYMYEHPFSIAVYCALKNRDSFPELNIIQIVQFYIGALNDKRPCHHFGNTGYTFSNLNVKNQFNLIKDYFNDVEPRKFVKLIRPHSHVLDQIQCFNIKILPQLSDCINDLANKIYERNKKCICCW